MKIRHLAASLLFVSMAAQATVGIAPTIAYMYEKDGVTKFEGGQLYLLVADTDRNGFGADGMGSIGVDYELGGDDQVLKAWNSPSSPVFAVGQCKPNALGLTLEGDDPGQFGAGDPFGVYFFDNISTTEYDSGTLAPGTDYGFFTDSEFVTPADGGDFTGSYTETVLLDQTVVPEPSSLLLGILAMAAVLRRRRINR